MRFDTKSSSIDAVSRANNQTEEHASVESPKEGDSATHHFRSQSLRIDRTGRVDSAITDTNNHAEETARRIWSDLAKRRPSCSAMNHMLHDEFSYTSPALIRGRSLKAHPQSVEESTLDHGRGADIGKETSCLDQSDEPRLIEETARIPSEQGPGNNQPSEPLGPCTSNTGAEAPCDIKDTETEDVAEDMVISVRHKVLLTHETYQINFLYDVPYDNDPFTHSGESEAATSVLPIRSLLHQAGEEPSGYPDSA